MYALEQATREWHRELACTLVNMAFHAFAADPALSVTGKGKHLAFLWVDDLFIFSEPMGLQELKQDILTVFKGRDLGHLRSALGAEILRDSAAKTITICQSRKVIGLLGKFGMSDCKLRQLHLCLGNI